MIKFSSTGACIWDAGVQSTRFLMGLDLTSNMNIMKFL